MSKQMWPDECAKELEKLFGKGNVTPPMSFSRTRKGVSYFNIKLDQSSRVDGVISLLQSIGIEKNSMIDAYKDIGSDMYKGVLRLHIPKSAALSTVALIINHSDDIKIELEKEIKPAQPSIKSDYNKISLDRKISHMGSKSAEGMLSTSCPELNALAFHYLNSEIPLPDTLLNWIVPPQSPNGLMMVINDDGKLDLATTEQTEELTTKYHDVVKQRFERLVTPPQDFMFNKNTGEIETLPAGTVYNLLKQGDKENIGPSTYWNPKEAAYFDLYQRNIDMMPNASPSMTTTPSMDNT